MPVLILFLLAVAVLTITSAHRLFASRDERSLETYHRALEHLQGINAHPQVHIESEDRFAYTDPVGGHAPPGHVRILPERQLRFQELLPSPATRHPVLEVPHPRTGPVPTTHQRTPPVGLPAGGSELVFIDDAVGEGSPAPPVARAPDPFSRQLRLVRTAALATASAGVAVALTMALRPPAVHHAPKPRVAFASQAAAPRAAKQQPPPPAPMQPVNSSADSATYAIPSGPINLTVTAVGRCWLELRSGSMSGPISFEGILGPGDAKAFPGLAGMWLRIGDPHAVTVSIDGAAIALPASAVPYDVTVEASATPSA